jgi:hypothetical protein
MASLSTYQARPPTPRPPVDYLNVAHASEYNTEKLKWPGDEAIKKLSALLVLL